MTRFNLINTSRIMLSLLAAAAMAFTLSCATKQQTGALAGAGAGGVAGAALTEGSAVGTLVGAVLGAAVGSEIGRSMDQYDRERAARVLEYNQTYETSTWINPDDGSYYRMTPVETYERAETYCREFRMDTRIGDRWEEVYGTACRQPDGSWQIMS